MKTKEITTEKLRKMYAADKVMKICFYAVCFWASFV